WNTLDFKDGYSIKKFLEFRDENEPYYFTPSVLQPFELPPKFLTDFSIKKYHLRVKRREELLKNDPEFQSDPSKQKEKKSNKKQTNPPLRQPDIIDDIEKSLSNPIDIGFMPNHGKSVGVINLCYDGDCIVEYEAYKHFMNEVDNKEVTFKIIDFDKYIDVLITIHSKGRQLQLTNLKYDKNNLENFIKVNGGGKIVALLIGYPPANERKVILGKDMSPIVITWEYEKITPATNY
ncbi:hypothetical protein KJ766_00785, partial [Patescibacteria group bacterium]|nr:hypothetical protein [Patescibacteria group bacterium]